MLLQVTVKVETYRFILLEVLAQSDARVFVLQNFKIICFSNEELRISLVTGIDSGWI